MSRFAKIGVALLSGLLGAGYVAAQAPPGPLPPKPGTKVQQPPPQIRVRVDLVTTPVTVLNSAGEMVLTLAQRDFRILDNGVPQTIERFDLGGEPVSVVIAVEVSSRVESLLPAVRRAGILFSETVMGQSGEAAIVAFHDDTELRLPFTASHDDVEKAIAQLPLGTSGTRLYDAMARGVAMLSERPAPRRRVLLVVAEAADTGSESQLGEVLRAAQLNNIIIYSVGLSSTAAELRNPPKGRGPISATPPGTFGRPPIPGTVQTPTSEQQRSGNVDLLALLWYLVEHLKGAVGDNSLEVATLGTGGRHMGTFRDASIERAISDIGGELHAQYSLSYRPSGIDSTGHHDIKVEVRGRGLTVRARPGYYVPPPSQ